MFTHVYAILTHRLRIVLLVYAMFTLCLRIVYVVFTQMLNVYAMFTQRLRNVYATFTQRLRNVYPEGVSPTDERKRA